MCTVMPILDPQVGVALSRHCLVQCEQTKAENRCSDNAEFLCEKGYGHTEYSKCFHKHIKAFRLAAIEKDHELEVAAILIMCYENWGRKIAIKNVKQGTADQSPWVKSCNLCSLQWTIF